MNTHSRMSILSVGLFCVVATSAILLFTQANARGSQTRPAVARPNLVVIALDDVGFSDLGAFGSEIATPHIDSLAKRGLRYTRFDTNATCSATRASFLTGRNAQTVRMTALPSDLTVRDANDTSAYKGEIPQNIEFLPEALRRAGYATFGVGN